MKLFELLKEIVKIESPDQYSFTVSKNIVEIDDDSVYSIEHINDIYSDADGLTYEDILNWYESLPESEKLICQNYVVYFKDDGLYIEDSNSHNGELLSLHYTEYDGVLDMAHPYFLLDVKGYTVNYEL
jgi:hypothetical protein